MSKIVFFLGAGASKAAGVPTTVEMVDGFLQELEGVAVGPEVAKPASPAYESALEVVTALRAWAKRMGDLRRADVEQLMALVERVADAASDPITETLATGKDGAKRMHDAAQVRDALRNYIRRICVIKRDAVGHLKPLRQFVAGERPEPLDVFTTNYDTAIEQFCVFYGLRYADGFGAGWNKQSYEAPADLRLYKVHGSVTWARSETGLYLRMPAVTLEPEVTLFTQEKARYLLVYPASKLDLSEPILDCLDLLRQRLLGAKVVVVAGYTFRDDHLLDIFFDAAKANRDLRLVLVSPGAERVYDERLRAHPGGGMSPLQGRVIRLPYKFEDFFEILRPQVINRLLQAAEEESARTQELMLGQRPVFAWAISSYADAEDVDGLERTVAYLAAEDFEQVSIETWGNTWFAEYMRMRWEQSASFASLWLKALDGYDPARMEIQVRGPENLGVTFTLPGYSSQTPRNLIVWFERIRDRMANRLGLLPAPHRKLLEEPLHAIDGLIQLWKAFEFGPSAVASVKKVVSGETGQRFDTAIETSKRLETSSSTEVVREALNKGITDVLRREYAERWARFQRAVVSKPPGA